MTRWELHPFVGFGVVRFGSDRTLIRQQLGPDYEVFRKSSTSINDTDSYARLGIHLYYDRVDGLNFVEAFSLCAPVYFQEISFFARTVDQLIIDMTKSGYPGGWAISGETAETINSPASSVWTFGYAVKR